MQNPGNKKVVNLNELLNFFFFCYSFVSCQNVISVYFLYQCCVELFQNFPKMKKNEENLFFCVFMCYEVQYLTCSYIFNLNMFPFVKL